MKHKLILITLVLAICTIPTGPLAQELNGSDEEWDTYLSLVIIDRALQFGDEYYRDVELPEKWMPLAKFVKRLPDTYKDKIPISDGWGRPFMIGAAQSIEQLLFVVSAGEDGVSDAMVNFEDLFEEAYLIGLDKDALGDDLLLRVGGPVYNRPLSLQDQLDLAKSMITSYGWMLDRYAYKNGFYPVQVESLLSVRFVIDLIPAPSWQGELPERDPWGSEILYWSDGTECIVISPGADGLLDRDYYLAPGALEEMEFAGAVEDPNMDLISVNGELAQWPVPDYQRH